MPNYVWCLSTEEREAANATRWARLTEYTQVPTSVTRRVGSLSDTGAGDTVVIVAHGSPLYLGTSGTQVSYDPTQISNLLIGILDMKDGVRVVLAACNSKLFATSLEQVIRRKRSHRRVRCVGQVGNFRFGAAFRP
jgi:hypothetical protein